MAMENTAYLIKNQENQLCVMNILRLIGVKTENLRFLFARCETILYIYTRLL